MNSKEEIKIDTNPYHTKPEKNRHNSFKYMGMMGLCCLLPILIAGIIPILGAGAGSSFLLSRISSLICPVMMIVMMMLMFKSGSKHNCCKTENGQDTGKNVKNTDRS